MPDPDQDTIPATSDDAEEAPPPDINALLRAAARGAREFRFSLETDTDDDNEETPT